MKPMLTIVASYKRSHKVPVFAQNYLDNSSGLSKVVFVLEESDPFLDDYQRVMPDSFEMIVGNFGSYPKAVNAAFVAHRNHSLYFVAADDIHMRTRGFEERFIEELSEDVGIVYPNDLLQRQNLPTHAVLHGDIGRSLGYLAYPDFKHLYVDNWWRELGKHLPKYKYLDDVVAEHMHFSAGKSPNDEVYQSRNSSSMYEHDESVINRLINDGIIERDARIIMEYASRVRS